MVGLGRVELPTNGLGNRCSIHLSYRPTDRMRVAQTLPGFKATSSSNWSILRLEMAFGASRSDRQRPRLRQWRFTPPSMIKCPTGAQVR
jgi:hypothetical protein